MDVDTFVWLRPRRRQWLKHLDVRPTPLKTGGDMPPQDFDLGYASFARARPMINQVLRQCYRFRRLCTPSPRALILMYHRVLPSPGEDSLGINVSLANFTAHLTILKKRHAVVTMGELARQLRENVLGPSQIVITVDDGYHDGYRHALPALRAAVLPATFFVPTGPVGGVRPLVDQRLARSVETTAATELRLRDGTTLPLGTRNDRHLAVHRILRDMASLSEQGREELLRSIAGRLAVEEREPWRLDMPVSWSELREMRRQGMTIGCHGRSHRSLAELPAQQMQRELEGSRELMEERLGARIRFLSYPYGRPRNVSREVVACARRAGFELGCTASPGPVLPGSDPFLLRRMEVRNWGRREFQYQVERALCKSTAIEGFNHEC